MKKYLIVAEKTDTGYSAFSPDLPGCVATGRTRAELEKTMREAVLFHLDGLREDHEAIPLPQSYCTVCEVPA
jgi:predicted RNase H-like HicB family nuclease